MNKLNLTFPDINTPAAKANPSGRGVFYGNYTSPIGNWEVTTEGDCEGRSIKNLGIFYGHIVEIAFYLADRCYYTLQFKPHFGIQQKAPIYTASKRDVWISLAIGSETWNMTHEQRTNLLRKWFDLEDKNIKVLPSSPQASYYAGTYLKYEGK